VNGVNVCIHDFDDVKRRIKQGSFASRLMQDCFNKQSLASRLTQDQALPLKQSAIKTFKALINDYQAV